MQHRYEDKIDPVQIKFTEIKLILFGSNLPTAALTNVVLGMTDWTASKWAGSG